MKIFVINLDRKPQRWQRMAGLLRGLDFHRVRAVDGTGLDGLEFNVNSRSPSHENLSRFGRACAMSHRLACQEFLGGKDDFCCIMEDDVLLAPDFSRFISETGWIPGGSKIVRLETTRQKILLGAQSLPALDRRLFRLESLHLGSAGYILSRRGAELLLAHSIRPDRAIDRIMFDDFGREIFHPIWQLFPAICIQGYHAGMDEAFPELKSSVQPPRKVMRLNLPEKIRRELLRPFRDWRRPVSALQRLWRGQRRLAVPFE